MTQESKVEDEWCVSISVRLHAHVCRRVCLCRVHKTALASLMELSTYSLEWDLFLKCGLMFSQLGWRTAVLSELG